MCKENSYCNFSMYGPGVEKVFEELKKFFQTKGLKYFQAIIEKKTKFRKFN